MEKVEKALAAIAFEMFASRREMEKNDCVIFYPDIVVGLRMAVRIMTDSRPNMRFDGDILTITHNEKAYRYVFVNNDVHLLA